MQNEIVSFVYDRKKEIEKKGYGKVEIRIYLGNKVRKYVTIHSCDPFEWKEYQKSEELRTQLAIYRHVVATMALLLFGIRFGKIASVLSILIHAFFHSLLITLTLA